MTRWHQLAQRSVARVVRQVGRRLVVQPVGACRGVGRRHGRAADGDGEAGGQHRKAEDESADDGREGPSASQRARDSPPHPRQTRRPPDEVGQLVSQHHCTGNEPGGGNLTVSGARHTDRARTGATRVARSPRRTPGDGAGYASATAATSFWSVSLASPKSMVVLGS